ncbi:MAG TPA: adenylate/guanylate cyclase domain-containing protein [Dongiaceae bacterium]|nr:adenylate/guanylate cyclase domain-containing protein [Dongiaceae bacterium]
MARLSASTSARLGFAIIAALIGLLCGFATEKRLSAGLSFDTLLTLRHMLLGDRHAADASRVAVVTVDEATFADPAFADTPMALWAPQFAKVLSALDEAGAAVIGVDLLFATTTSSIEGMREYDKPLRAVFQRLGAQERIVLAQANVGGKMIGPHRIFAFVVGGQKNIRTIAVTADRDGVVRHVPLLQSGRNLSDPESIPAFALTLAERTGFDHATLPSDRLSVSPNYSDRQIAPVYGMQDLYACAQAGDIAALKKAFAGKVVLLGGALDIEDRKVISGRAFATAEGGARSLPCGGSRAQDSTMRRTIPGVFIHAQTINDLLRGDIARFWPLWSVIVSLGLLSAAGGGLAMALRAPSASVALAATFLVWTGIGVSSAAYDWMAPLMGGIGSGIVAFLVGLGLRNLVIDRERRRSVLALSRYLDARVARDLLDSDRPPKLGGEIREITIWFSDIAGFSTVAERLDPESLVKRLNHHFTLIGAVIVEEGGIVEKYVGDGVVAIFGAPVPQSDHAARAVRAALRVQEMLAAEAGDPESFKIRIGINTGTCVVGNVGSEGRFDYTAIGDAVNVAARLEAANKEHGTAILASNATVRAAGAGFRFREIGAIHVKGRVEPVAVSEVLGLEPQPRSM